MGLWANEPRGIRQESRVEASNGNRDGKPFYGCSNYPRCDYTLPMQKVPITAETPRCTCGGFLVPCHNHANGQDFMGCTSYHDLQPYKHVSYSLSLPG